LPAVTLEVLRQAAVAGAEPMAALRAGAATLDLDAREGEGVDDGADDGLPDLPGWQDRPAALEQALRLLARMPSMVAAFDRLRRGLEPVDGDRALDQSLGHAAAFLYRLEGKEPSAARVRALDAYLDTVIDHGCNASTFTARVIVSTGADLTSAVVGAIGALSGPLHGGAPGPALDLVFEIGSTERAEAVLRAKLAAGERLMGFGHRVYKVRDPRAAVLAEAAEALYGSGEARSEGEMGGDELYRLFRHVEETATRLLDEHKPGRLLRANVELYTALLLHGLGLSTDLFTPVFAMARTAGWLAHCREQVTEGRLIRPRLHYVGE
jgi:citrate synthase